MDNLFEYLIPIVFAAVYFFGNMLSKKSGDEAAPGREPEDADAIERQRHIQEEIRRKIMERREGGRQSPSASESARDRESPHSRRQPQPSASESARDRESPYSHRQPQPSASVEQRRETREQHKKTRQAETSIHKRQTREDARQQPQPGFTWDKSDNAYDHEMQAKLQQIEATKQKAEKLKKQAAQSQTRRTTSSKNSSLPTPHSPLSRASVRSTLRSPAAARAAFIYSEVLGPPISQRKTQTVPGLVS